MQLLEATESDLMSSFMALTDLVAWLISCSNVSTEWLRCPKWPILYRRSFQRNGNTQR